MNKSVVDNNELLGLTTDIVSSHVANNTVTVSEVSALIEEVYKSLCAVGERARQNARALEPVVPINKSVTPDHIICLEDGKKLKMMKRHLKSRYDMTPEEYRERWGLPHDYPMVAPNYAKHRSTLAKKIGLGTKSRREA